MKWMLAIAVLGMGCAKGSEATLYQLPSGPYELLTVKVDAPGCALDDAITVGPEHVGKVMRVEADSTERRLRLQTCDPFFEDDCFVDASSHDVTLPRAA